MNPESQKNGEEYIERLRISATELRWLKNEWKNEIPQEVIYGGQDDKKSQRYKVRKNWWGSVVTHMDEVLLFLDQKKHSELIKKINKFISDYTGVEFQGKTGRLTTEQDINRADKLIDEVILAVENLQNDV